MRIFLFIFFHFAASLTMFGQEMPRWVDSHYREQAFPNNTFLSGFAMDDVSRGESVGSAAERVKKLAQGNLAESIRTAISGSTLYGATSENNGGYYTEKEIFIQRMVTAFNAEIAGMKTETWYHKKENSVYAFVYADRHELAAYYTAAMAAHVPQLRGMLQTATQLENAREKAQAHRQYTVAWRLLEKTENERELHIALDRNITGEALLPAGLSEIRSELLQALARTELTIYINDHETISDVPCTMVADRLKAALAGNGYSFTDHAAQADWTLTLHAATRNIGNDAPIVFCYADVTVELTDNAARRSVYSHNVSHKGGSTTYERAGREALKEAAEEITKSIGDALGIEKAQ
jgi:hypothetical protein